MNNGAELYRLKVKSLILSLIGIILILHDKYKFLLFSLIKKCMSTVRITALNIGNSSNLKLSQLELTLIAHFLIREKYRSLNLSCNIKRQN